MAELRPKIVKLAKIVGGIAGTLNKIDADAPEYYALDCVVNDEQADVALTMGLRKPRTCEYVTKKCGKSYERTHEILMELAKIGVCKVWHDEGEELFWINIFAPGMLEMMVNNREHLEAHPQIGKAFEAYTRTHPSPMTPMIPQGMAMMRVIPIESALEGVEGVEPWETLSYILTNTIPSAYPTAPAGLPAATWTRAAAIWSTRCACRWAPALNTTSISAEAGQSPARRLRTSCTGPRSWA